MLNNIKFFTIFLFLYIGNSISVKAIDVVPAEPDTVVVIIEEDDSSIKRYIPYIQFAIGFSQRADHSNLINHSPMTHAKIYYSLSDKISGKFGVGYNSSNNFKSSIWETIKYSNLKIETGFRWNLFSEIFTFYHENGLEYNYYSESQGGIWEHRIGMNFSLGFTFSVHEQFEFDIAVSQTINNVSFGSTKNISPSLSPIGLKDERFFNEVFNPLAIQILLFKKL